MEFSTMKFLLFGFALDRMQDHIVFTSFRVLNIYIADFVKSNFMQNENDVKDCEPMHNYTFESHIYNHGHDVKIGWLVSVPLNGLALYSPNKFGKIYKHISVQPLNAFGELVNTPKIFQPIYDIVYEQPHTIMHIIDSFTPYHDIFVNNIDPKCMIENSIKEIDHEISFIWDYYSIPIKKLYDFYLDSTTNDIQQLC